MGTGVKVAGVALLAVLATAVLWWRSAPGGAPEPAAEPSDGAPPPRASYSGSASCAECHAEEMAAWKGSDHERAMGLATPENVRGDFGDVEVEHFGVTSRFHRRDGHYLIDTESRSGEIETFEIAYTFGWHPLQQYLVRFPDGRIQTLPWCWDTERKRWFHIYPDDRVGPDDELHWTRPLQNWDHMCAECHSTNVRKRFDLDTRSWSTSFSEISVGCEACHGPGSRHIELARREPPDWSAPEGFALVDLNSTSRTMVENCAVCHTRRAALIVGHQPGENFYDAYLPELIVPYAPQIGREAYYADGQIKEEDYVYGSFIQSKMYSKKVRCTDCHDAHTMRLRASGNQLCNRCHDEHPENPRVYDTPAHHHHEEGKAGSLCVECHMPETTYMVVDPRRDHSLRVPRPELSEAYGIPNACNRCHHEKSASWSRTWIEKWYGPERAPERHHTGAITAARDLRPEGAAALTAMLATRPLVNAFTRASGLLLLRHYDSPETGAAAERALADPEPLVRLAAMAKIESEGDQAILAHIPPLLTDQRRIVRMEAARLLYGPLAARLNAALAGAFERARAELDAGHAANLDRAETHLALGILATRSSRPEAAEREYRIALELDDLFVPARVNLAMLLNSRGRNKEAEALLREVVRLRPGWADGHYSLGLLLAEDPARMAEACEHLGRAARMLPSDVRMQYNYALSLWKSNRLDEAATILRRICDLAPRQPDYPLHLAQLYYQQKKLTLALRYATRSAALAPGDPQRRDFVRRIEAALR